MPQSSRAVARTGAGCSMSARLKETTGKLVEIQSHRMWWLPIASCLREFSQVGQQLGLVDKDLERGWGVLCKVVVDRGKRALILLRLS
jgi:hypothetical protein